MDKYQKSKFKEVGGKFEMLMFIIRSEMDQLSRKYKFADAEKLLDDLETIAIKYGKED